MPRRRGAAGWYEKRMRFFRVALPAAALALAFVASENTAHALGPIDIEAGAKVGVATNPSDGNNPYGFGLGLRGGVGIFGFYGGISAVHYFGSDVDVLVPGQSDKPHLSTTLLGLELGYTISAIPIINIRPQLGIGNATFYVSGGGSDTSDSHVYVEPGVVVLVPLGLVYVGADVNALIIPGVDVGTESKTYTSLTIHGQVGVRF